MKEKENKQGWEGIRAVDTRYGNLEEATPEDRYPAGSVEVHQLEDISSPLSTGFWSKRKTLIFVKKLSSVII